MSDIRTGVSTNSSRKLSWLIILLAFIGMIGYIYSQSATRLLPIHEIEYTINGDVVDEASFNALKDSLEIKYDDWTTETFTTSPDGPQGHGITYSAVRISDGTAYSFTTLMHPGGVTEHSIRKQ